MSSISDESAVGKIPVCGLGHRMKIEEGGLNGPCGYRCCDARDCYWKEQAAGISLCLYQEYQ
ncbi:MAG: hypothetical protein ACYDEQ_08610 [Desulfocucumaceae bacterium]